MANEFKIKKGLIVQGSGSTVLDIQGSQGQLFSVTDNLSGSLFSVNDISGLPILQVSSDDSVKLGTFNAEAIKVSGSNAIITGSLFGTASWAVSASWAPVATTAATASFVTASNVYGPFGSNSILSSSFAQTASFAPLYLPLTGGTINGNVTVNGTASIAFLNVQYESASVIYSSGSNVFGDATNDIQTLVGTVLVSGSQQITGSLIVTAGITGSLQGTASYALQALSSSFASTSSFLGSTTNAFIQNGNSFGTTALLGTNDNQSLALETNGTTRMFISSSGDVGIGTTSPAARLHISGTIEGGSLNATGVFIDTLLRTSNVNNLTQTGLSLKPTFNTVSSNVGNAYGLDISPTITGAYNVANAYGLSVNAPTLSSGTVTNRYAAVFNGGNVGIGTAGPGYPLSIENTAEFLLTYKRTGGTSKLWGFGADNSSTYFKNLTDSTIAYTITNGGSVGIGTTLPSASLQVENNLFTQVIVKGTETTRAAEVLIVNSADKGLNINVSGPTYASGIQNSARISPTGTGMTSIGIGTSRSSTTASFVVNTSTNRVGINKETPTEALDVSGSAIISGSFTVTPGTVREFQVRTTGVDIGNLIADTHTVTGSLNVSGSITGSLFGTASWAVSASWAPVATTAATASFVTASNVYGPFGSSSILSSSFAVSASNAATATNVAYSGLTGTVPTWNQSTTGNASTATLVTGTSGQLQAKDDRVIEPNSITTARLQFGFTSWGNNNGSPYADYLHLRSYSDGSGGNDNLVMFRKDAIGMRIWQQAYGSATAYSSFKDVAWTDGTNASGNWTINVTGSLFGTSSYATSASYALTSSFLNGGTNGFVQGGNSFGTTALLGTNDNQPLAFETNGSTRMFISSSGNVGIGTTAPDDKLHVVSTSAGLETFPIIVQNASTTINTKVGIKFAPAATSRYSAIQGIQEDGSNTIGLGLITGVGPTITEKVRITGGGNVGIGTTNPSERLTVSGSLNINSEGSYIGADAQAIPRLGFVKLSGAQPFLGFAQSSFDLKVSSGTTIATSNTFSSVLTAKTTGEVGIGTTVPEGKLHVNQTTNLGGTAGNSLILQTLQNTGGSGGNNVYVKDYAYRDATGTNWTTWRHHNSIDIDGSHNTPGTNTLTFWERDPFNGIHYFGHQATNTMAIDGANGRVGIGTTSPASRLDVSINDNAYLSALTVSNTNTGTQALSQLVLSTANNSTGLFQIRQFNNGGAVELANYANAPVNFWTSGSERMRIDSSGNVGIGTTIATEKLDVAGVIRGVLSDPTGVGGITAKLLSFAGSPYGLVFRSSPTGTHTIQNQREANDTEVYPIILQPNGSNVGIGINPSAKLHVQGDISGSTKLTIGSGHTNTGISSSIAGGVANTASGNCSFVGGGSNNQATQIFSTVAGGCGNQATGQFTVIGGGNQNIAAGYNSTIAGGQSGRSPGQYSTIGGGVANCSIGAFSTVAGGYDNHATLDESTVGGGRLNRASGSKSTVGGGCQNLASGLMSSILGGYNNIGSGQYSTVGGGVNNNSTNNYSTVGGGVGNISSNQSSTVAGGQSNQATQIFSTVAGGVGNQAKGEGSFIGSGNSNIASGSYSGILGGVSNTVTHACSFIIGTSLTSTSGSTTYMNNATVACHLQVGGTTTMNTTTGRIDASNDVVAFATSDYRLKENIQPIKNALCKLIGVSGNTFDWKPLTQEEIQTIHGNKGRDVGVIAQEIEAILPEAVTTRDNGYKAVNYEKIIPLLIEAIKDQQKQIDELKSKL